MSHMVIYRGADGKPGYHQADDIHDAVGFVEQMRNSEGVEHARIFRLEEVVFEYRPYYRVQLAQAAGSGIPEGTNPARLAESTMGEHHMPAVGEGDRIDLTDEVIEIRDGIDDGSDLRAEAGMGKKGLFGR